MTLEQLRRTVGRKAGMDYSAAGDDRNLIDQWLNDAVREVLLRTHCYTAASLVTTTADEWQYDLSTNIMVVKMIWRDGDSYSMVRVSPDEVLQMRRAAGTDASTLHWAVMGTNMLMLWPTPTAAYDINLVYVPKPTELAENAHDPSNPTYGGIPVEYHKAIELRALADASDHEHEGGTQRGVNYLAQFDEFLKRVVRPSVNRKWGSLERARVGRRRAVSWDNDRYPRY